MPREIPISISDNRMTLLLSISYLNICLFFIFFLLEWNLDRSDLMTFNLAVCFVFIGNIVDMIIRKQYEQNIRIGLFFISLLFVYLFVTGGVNNSALLWCITYPLATCFLLGTVTGFVVSILMLVLFGFLQFFAGSTEFLVHYDNEVFYRFVGAYSVVCLFTYHFVRMWEKNEKELYKIQNTLQQQVNERTIKLQQINEQLLEDIKQRDKVEKRLAKKEQDYRQLLENTSDYIYTHDSEGRLIESNAHFKEVIGFTESELTGQKLTERIVEQTGLREYLERIQTEKQYSGVLSFITKSEGKRVLEYKSVLIENEGAPSVIKGVATDITEKINLEAQLFHAEKMKAMGTLAGGIAHDFNNILTAILGYSELALQSNSINEEVAESVKEIIIASETASDLVQQILTFCKQTRSENKAVALYEVVEDVLRLLLPSLSKNINVVKNLHSNAFVYGDPSKLYQIVMNLCTNSYHAMEASGGTLTLDLQEIPLVAGEIAKDLPAGKYCRLKVSDTGYGISPNQMKKIFDPYFSTKTPEQGTGLGLSVVLGIVQEYGGHITVDSSPDHGASFYVYLPVYELVPREQT